jgi:hypothetical protein
LIDPPTDEDAHVPFVVHEQYAQVVASLAGLGPASWRFVYLKRALALSALTYVL